MTDNISTKKRRVFDIISLGTKYDIPSRLFDYVLVSAIIINLLILIIETFDAAAPYTPFLKDIERIIVLFFIVEYILRVWTAEYLYPGCGKVKAGFKFIFSFNGIIDLFTILPYVIPVFLPAGFVAFRTFRVFRVFRLFRINTQYDAFNVVVDVLRSRSRQLFSSICMILIMMTASSICMYSLEHEAQPEVFRNAFSGIWWSVSALLTVGYGDIYPITTMGQIMAIIISFLGVGLVAIPTGIISAGFVEQFTNMRNFSQMSGGSDMTFVMLTLEDDHPWSGKSIRDISLPPELIISAVIRENEVIIPNGRVRFMVNDKVVLGALEFKDDIGLEFREFAITSNHPWKDRFLSEIKMEKDSIIVSILRHERVIIPRGNRQLHLGDLVTVCTRHQGGTIIP